MQPGILKVGDVVQYSAEFLRRLHIPGQLASSPEASWVGVIEDISSNGVVASVRWVRGLGVEHGNVKMVAVSNLWAEGKGVPNE